jgi:hypothetical protein
MGKMSDMATRQTMMEQPHGYVMMQMTMDRMRSQRQSEGKL